MKKSANMSDKVKLTEIWKRTTIFADVTPVCDDGQQVEAHKVILDEQVLF